MLTLHHTFEENCKGHLNISSWISCRILIQQFDLIIGKYGSPELNIAINIFAKQLARATFKNVSHLSGNRIMDIVKRFSILVIAFMIFAAVPPSSTIHPTQQTVIESATVTFRCSVIGNPAPNVTWSKDGMPVAKMGELSFQAFRNQSGKYWCSADNGLQPAGNASAVLDVQCKYKTKAYLLAVKF